MAIAVCSYCGGLVLMHSAMCPHCGQRGEAHASRKGVSKFGKRRNQIPLPIRRMIVAAMVGTGCLVFLALAHWVRPTTSVQRKIADLSAKCDEIAETGEEFTGELARCRLSLAHLRATAR